MSESGNFLGRIVVGQSLETALSLQNITPSWYRSNMEPFVTAAREAPFFFAWRPGSYPRELGYAWLAKDRQSAAERDDGGRAAAVGRRLKHLGGVQNSR